MKKLFIEQINFKKLIKNFTISLLYLLFIVSLFYFLPFYDDNKNDIKILEQTKSRNIEYNIIIILLLIIISVLFLDVQSISNENFNLINENTKLINENNYLNKLIRKTFDSVYEILE